MVSFKFDLSMLKQSQCKLIVALKWMPEAVNYFCNIRFKGFMIEEFSWLYLHWLCCRQLYLNNFLAFTFLSQTLFHHFSLPDSSLKRLRCGWRPDKYPVHQQINMQCLKGASQLIHGPSSSILRCKNFPF